jgi:hypothetical protein
VDSVTAPAGYIVPPEWTRTGQSALHGIQFRRTAAAESLTVEMTRFADVRMGAKPYEASDCDVRGFRFTARQYFPAGSIVVPTDQRAAHVAVHLLEPRSGDSFMAWGFFNAVLEQKEYAEDYVMESVGRNCYRISQISVPSTFEGCCGYSVQPQSREQAQLVVPSPPWVTGRSTYPVGRMDQNVLRTLQD